MESKSPPSTPNCDSCQASLADYVRLELNGQAAEEVYPEVAFHIEVCERCETAYYREFRTQGQHKTVAELQQVGGRAQVETVMRQILVPTLPEPPSPPDPDWRQVVLDYGRAWLEQETGRWRQLWFSLGNLGNTPQKAPVLAGMMGPEASSADVWLVWETAPPDANVEIKLTVAPDSAATDSSQCRVDIALTLKDHFGDFSGAQVTLLWAENAYVQETDAWGKVSFTGLPYHQLPAMSLQVVLPD